MSDTEIENFRSTYQEQFHIPVTDVLKTGVKPLIEKILSVFPELGARVHPVGNSENANAAD